MKILEVLDADSIGGWIRVSQAASFLTTGRTDSQTDFNMTWWLPWCTCSANMWGNKAGKGRTVKRSTTPVPAEIMRKYAVFVSGNLELECKSHTKHYTNTCNHSLAKLLSWRITPVVRYSLMKGDGTVWCCIIDYCALNAVMIRDSYSMPHVDDTLDPCCCLLICGRIWCIIITKGIFTKCIINNTNSGRN